MIAAGFASARLKLILVPYVFNLHKCACAHQCPGRARGIKIDQTAKYAFTHEKHTRLCQRMQKKIKYKSAITETLITKDCVRGAPDSVGKRKYHISNLSLPS